jgi:hypothetical protein
MSGINNIRMSAHHSYLLLIILIGRITFCQTIFYQEPGKTGDGQGFSKLPTIVFCGLSSAYFGIKFTFSSINHSKFLLIIVEKDTWL